MELSHVFFQMACKRSLLLILSAFAGSAWLLEAPLQAAAPAKPAGQPEEPWSAAKPGPWGQLETTPIYIEAPDYLMANVQKPNSIPQWCFPGANEASLRQLFARAGLPDAMQKRLFDPRRTLTQGEVITLFPTVPDLEAMTPEMRGVVYPELAKTPLNEFHHDPIFIIGGIDEWLRDTGLPAEIQALIRKMTYRRGRALVFSDLRTLLTHAKNEDEVQQICKSATRTRTLMAYLKIPADGVKKDIIDYWTGGYPDNDSLPLLHSLTERPYGSTLDITHLLPPLGRRRLYTYPTAELATFGRMPDCHWTSLNFFSLARQEYFLDTRLASQRVIERYFTIPPPYRFGDVLFFNNPAGETIHSCVFIADDIVFTKNGENSLAPWILMRLGDVQDIYLLTSQFNMQGYREKPAESRVTSTSR